mmetsp:Transcript_4965/g.21276  ORF Transcript_4965/g.21276 Transcript_4965/m.21276 type:complete len:212 (-) Transcript_4965:766-1401(-)
MTMPMPTMMTTVMTMIRRRWRVSASPTKRQAKASRCGKRMSGAPFGTTRSESHTRVGSGCGWHPAPEARTWRWAGRAGRSFGCPRSPPRLCSRTNARRCGGCGFSTARRSEESWRTRWASARQRRCSPSSGRCGTAALAEARCLLNPRGAGSRSLRLARRLMACPLRAPCHPRQPTPPLQPPRLSRGSRRRSRLRPRRPGCPAWSCALRPC